MVKIRPTLIVVWNVETSVEVKAGHAARTKGGFEAMEDVVQSGRLFIPGPATGCTPSLLVLPPLAQLYAAQLAEEGR